jgi:type IV secretory pathway VirB10-like protein
VSFSFIAASVTFTAAQEGQPSPNTVVVESGNDLRCRLEKGQRITKSGEPITAKLVEPVYAGTTLAIPEGSTIKGRVSSVSTAPLNKRARRLLSGDFTPPRIANVTFDQVILPDGAAVQIHTDTTVGIRDMQTAQYLPKSQRPGIHQKMKDAAKPLREPNKLQRLRQAAITSLPYHPEYLNQGTIFDATLLDPIRTPAPVQTAEAHAPLGDNYIHLRLLTPLKSEMIARGAAIEAAVSRPYYNSDHVLLYPAGTKVEGTVTKAVAAGWMKKNGQLLFSFRSARTPDGAPTDMFATVAGIQAAGGQRLVVGVEGNVRTSTSLFSRLRAPVSLIGPSRAVADSSLDKTAWSRAGEGRTGFGFLGAGAAQASAATAIGFGYFGAAVKMYDAFLAKGSNVELPVNTPILLRIDDKARSSALDDPQAVVMSTGVAKP